MIDAGHQCGFCFILAGFLAAGGLNTIGPLDFKTCLPEGETSDIILKNFEWTGWVKKTKTEREMNKVLESFDGNG